MRNIVWFFLLCLGSCSPDEASSVPDSTTFVFEDGFEVATPDLQRLFPGDGSRWTTIQQVGEDNQIDVHQAVASEGDYSLRIFAKATNTVLSKMGIEKSGFVAPENATVRIEADFYIASESDTENLLLIDLECCSCWDPTVPDNQCPGVRLMMKANDFLSIERGKLLGTTLTQTNVPFPRNEWVCLVWEMVLSPDGEGSNKLFINGQEAMSTNGMNMPNAALFKEEGATVGIDFALQEPVVYERLQIGATANPTQSDIEMFVDDFKLTITE
jgi:hypothetical protein